jgi:predicted MFS family arabinose efflux permease
MRRSDNAVWNNRDFVKLWIGQSVSQFGAQISLLALPLMAAQVLHATPFQMGILRAFEYLPFLLFGLFAGLAIDRRGCRDVLIISDLVRAACLAVVPVAALAGDLVIELLYLCAFVIGVAGVYFDVAYWSYLPSLVGRDQILDGNSKLSLSQSVAEAAGPGAGGLLIQLVSAPLAIMANAFSFLLSALSLVLIKSREERPAAAPIDHGGGLVHDLTRGLVFVWREATLRSLLLRSTVWNLLYNLAMPVFLLYCMNTLKLSASVIGMLFTALGAGVAMSALLMTAALSRFKVGTLICGSMLVAATGVCAIALPVSDPLLRNALLMGCLGAIGLANGVYNISNVSLRQALTPPSLLGRMTAAMRFVSWGIMPFGASLSGVLGERIGFAPALLLVGCVGLLTALLGLAGPVRHIAAVPKEPVAEPA